VDVLPVASEDNEDKTEAPTAHRLEKAREEGQIPRSKELTSLLIMLVGIGILWFGGEAFGRKLSLALSTGLRFDHKIISDQNLILGQIIVMLKSVLLGMLPLMTGVVIIALIMRLMSESPLTAMASALNLAGLCAMLVALSIIPMVGFDVFWQIHSHIKKLRMSRQDIRDEFKQSEGDPHIKGRIRQMQRAAARRRMMADVPKADVIVTNPTHYSVALQYDENKMSAPKVVAKGAGMVALRIRELGTENRVPILEAPPLARALYRHAEIGQQIPGQLYAAVAEVLAWVWQLKRWRLSGGQRPVKPENLPVPEALDFMNEKDTDG